MKLNQKEFTNLLTVLNVCKKIGVEQVIIERDAVRGATEDRMVVILQRENVTFSQQFGIGSVSSLLERLTLGSGMPEVELTISDEDFVRSCQISWGKMRVGYRFMHPQLIRAPKNISDTEIKCEFNLDADTMTVITRGIRAMSADNFSVVNSLSGVSVNILDVNGERLKCDLDIKSEVEFEHSYPKDVLTLINIADNDGNIKVSTKGILYINISGLKVAILPLMKD